MCMILPCPVLLGTQTDWLYCPGLVLTVFDCHLPLSYHCLLCFVSQKANLWLLVDVPRPVTQLREGFNWVHSVREYSPTGWQWHGWRREAAVYIIGQSGSGFQWTWGWPRTLARAHLLKVLQFPKTVGDQNRDQDSNKGVFGGHLMSLFRRWYHSLRKYQRCPVPGDFQLGSNTGGRGVTVWRWEGKKKINGVTSLSCWSHYWYNYHTWLGRSILCLSLNTCLHSPKATTI